MFGLNKYTLKNNVPSIIASGIVVILLVMIVFSFKGYQTDNDQINRLQEEIKTLNTRMVIINTNKKLGEEKINDYNKLLSQLIPDTEDFFSIVYALEDLSQKTGFKITEYILNLSASTKDKFALDVRGTGDRNTFLEFLKKYSFSSGRLITNENIKFLTNMSTGTVSLSLNFYNKKVLTGTTSVEQISVADLKLMDSIKSKFSISFKNPVSEEVESYPTKNNPF